MQKRKLKVVEPKSFRNELLKLPEKIIILYVNKIRLLAENPKHPSLRTHVVAKTHSGHSIFSSSINMAYRWTWQYSENRNEVILRHIGSHKIYKNP